MPSNDHQQVMNHSDPTELNVLFGKRIAITRPEAQTSEFAEMLRSYGAIPILFPTIATAVIDDNFALDDALRHLPNYDWVVFTSVNGVRIALDRLTELELPTSHITERQIAVIGPATARMLDKYGINYHLVPSEYVAEAIFQGLSDREPLSGKRFLLLRADIARKTLFDQLVGAGAKVDEIAVYHTIAGQPSADAYDQLRAGVDAITFSSSSTVRYFFQLLGDAARTIAEKSKIICIGPITNQTAVEYGLKVALVADQYTVAGLLAALQQAFRG